MTRPLREVIADLISEAAQTKAELISDKTTSDYRHGWQSGRMAALDEVRQAIAALPQTEGSEVREALGALVKTAEHARVFIGSREKMHPDGRSLYDEDVERARQALAPPAPESGGEDG